MFSRKRKDSQAAAAAVAPPSKVAVPQSPRPESRGLAGRQQHPPPPQPPPSVPAMSSTTTTTTTNHPSHAPRPTSSHASSALPISPLQMTFDFELPPSSSPSPSPATPAESSVRPATADAFSNRPRTSDGLLREPNPPFTGPQSTSRSGSSLGLAPPFLPPIPRVASTVDHARKSSDEVAGSSRTSTASPSTSTRGRFKIFGKSIEELNASPTSRPGSSAASPSMLRPQSSRGERPPRSVSPSIGATSATASPIMESSLFPVKAPDQTSLLPSIDANPVMNRAWLDARDKPYSPASTTAASSVTPPPTKTPFAVPTANHSSPDLLSLGGAPPPRSMKNFSTRSPNSPSSPATLAAPRPGQISFSSSPNLLQQQQRPSTSSGPRQASYIGLLPTQSKDDSTSPSALTVGTPYSRTSSSFPLPKHVATRPRTAGAGASIAGVSVPTHHTSAKPSDPPPAPSTKSEKRKTRLLINPMNLLSRRKSAQDEEEAANRERQAQDQRAAQAQALARQRNVATLGVNRLPEDYDPRIRGKVVHDFSAPRPSRPTFTFNDAAEGLRAMEARQIQSPSESADAARSGHSKQTSESSGSSGARRSAHTPMFMEHLSETPDAAKRISSIQAERRENKDFLQRASAVSSVSALSSDSAAASLSSLPPFARRSQNVDPTQLSAALSPNDSTASSDLGSGSGFSSNARPDRDSAPSSVSGVSPVTARSSAFVPPFDVRQSLSPVSPSSPAKMPFRTSLNPLEISSSGLRPTSASATRPYSALVAQPAVTPIAEEQRRSAPSPQTPNLDSAPPPAAATPPPHRSPPVPLPQPSASPLLSTSAVLSPPTPSAPGRSPAASPFLANSPFLAASVTSLPSNQPTPEPQTASTLPLPRAPSSPPRLVEKRASAVGHTKSSTTSAHTRSSKSSNSAASVPGVPRHHVSNASRFSFQFGGSAAEEEKLEEKHRKMASGVPVGLGLHNGDADGAEDEDEFFDEDAMDDLDEMELQARATQGPAAVAGAAATATAAVAAPGPLDALSSLQAARLQLVVPDSDVESMGSRAGDEDLDDAESGYYDDPEFQAALLQSRSGSIVTTSPTTPMRAHAAIGDCMLAGNTNLPGISGVSGVQTVQQHVQQAQQQQEKSTNSETQAVKPSLPHRDSGNSERNRVASGMSFQAPVVAAEADQQQPQPQPQQRRDVTDHRSGLSTSTASSGILVDTDKRSFSRSTGAASSLRSSDPRTTPASTGLGLSGFGDFHFSESPTQSRPSSNATWSMDKHRRLDSETIPQHVEWAAAELIDRGSPDSGSRATRSTGYPQMRKGSHVSVPSSSLSFQPPLDEEERETNGVAYHGSVGKHIHSRSPTAQETLQIPLFPPSDEDDIYFDDGGFVDDVNARHDSASKLDETRFDDPSFLSKPARPDSSSSSFRPPSSTFGTSGPYPSFAMPNPIKARQRDSQMLLEDLPLLAHVDPKLIPQRNPSEDAKRLGLSNKVPPLPAPPGNVDAMQRVQANLLAYHASLAEAANRAAAEGRFSRMPSNASTTVGGRLSVLDPANADEDDKSTYSRNIDGVSPVPPSRTATLDTQDGRNGESTLNSLLNPDAVYSPPKLSFDFGFDATSVPTDSPTGGGLFGEEEDDIVAAANAEVLASEDAAFYGHEFGFYAHARPSSRTAGGSGSGANGAASGAGTQPQAIHGGFFDDDGIASRGNFALAEPNLTPITERSEFSTRNSFIGLGAFPAVPGSGRLSMSAAHHPAAAAATAAGPLASSPLLPVGDEITSFDQLRRMRASAFGGSNGSISSLGSIGTTGGRIGGSPMVFTHSSNSEGSNPRLSSTVFAESPHSASSSGQLPFSSNSPVVTTNVNISGDVPMTDPESTPRNNKVLPPAANMSPAAIPPRGPQQPYQQHSRKSSGADSVTYIREPDPAGTGAPRWVLERRRTSELGLSEVVGREVVQGGWI